MVGETGDGKALDKKTEEKRIYDVLYEEKVLDKTGKVYLPKSFREILGLKAGDKVVISLYEMPREIRLRKKKAI